MCNYELKPLIAKFKRQDMGVFPTIYNEFKGLIIHYGRKLGFDDAVEELNLFFIELLYGLDLSDFSNNDDCGIQKYIAISLRNRYISLSKLNQKYKYTFDNLYENTSECSQGFEDSLFVQEALSHLPERQRMILVYKYIYMYSDYEIACLLDITRQAVNRLKNRGLKSIRGFLENESIKRWKNGNLQGKKIMD